MRVSSSTHISPSTLHRCIALTSQAARWARLPPSPLAWRPIKADQGGWSTQSLTSPPSLHRPPATQPPEDELHHPAVQHPPTGIYGCSLLAAVLAVRAAIHMHV